MTDKTATNESTGIIHKNKGLSLFLGIMLITIGLFAINARMFISTTTIYFFGWILLLGGGAQCFASLYAGSWAKFFITLATGVISFIVGLAIVINPALSVETLTMFIGIVLVADGVFRFISSLITRTEHWVLHAASGLLLFLLGVAIWYIRPGNLGLIGLLVGVGLIVSGFLTIIHAYSHRETPYKQQLSAHA